MSEKITEVYDQAIKDDMYTNIEEAQHALQSCFQLDQPIIGGSKGSQMRTNAKTNTDMLKKIDPSQLYKEYEYFEQSLMEDLYHNKAQRENFHTGLIGITTDLRSLKNEYKEYCNSYKNDKKLLRICRKYYENNITLHNKHSQRIFQHLAESDSIDKLIDTVIGDVDGFFVHAIHKEKELHNTLSHYNYKRETVCFSDPEIASKYLAVHELLKTLKVHLSIINSNTKLGKDTADYIANYYNSNTNIVSEETNNKNTWETVEHNIHELIGETHTKKGLQVKALLSDMFSSFSKRHYDRLNNSSASDIINEFAKFMYDDNKFLIIEAHLENKILETIEEIKKQNHLQTSITFINEHGEQETINDTITFDYNARKKQDDSTARKTRERGFKSPFKETYDQFGAYIEIQSPQITQRLNNIKEKYGVTHPAYQELFTKMMKNNRNYAQKIPPFIDRLTGQTEAFDGRAKWIKKGPDAETWNITYPGFHLNGHKFDAPLEFQIKLRPDDLTRDSYRHKQHLSTKKIEYVGPQGTEEFYRHRIKKTLLTADEYYLNMSDVDIEILDIDIMDFGNNTEIRQELKEKGGTQKHEEIQQLVSALSQMSYHNFCDLFSHQNIQQHLISFGQQWTRKIQQQTNLKLNQYEAAHVNIKKEQDNSEYIQEISEEAKNNSYHMIKSVLNPTDPEQILENNKQRLIHHGKQTLLSRMADIHNFHHLLDLFQKHGVAIEKKKHYLETVLMENNIMQLSKNTTIAPPTTS